MIHTDYSCGRMEQFVGQFILYLMTHGILFFADRLPPFIGGMEVHAKYFIDFFENNRSYKLLSIISKDIHGNDILVKNEKSLPVDINNLSNSLNPHIVFFNSGRWIEQLAKIRKMFPQAKFIYRTGGNEILKAPLEKNFFSRHSQRQNFWVKTINKTIDTLITNSEFTEKRLENLGVSIQFIRCVGGVEVKKFSPPEQNVTKKITLFCAARFVPYKNHKLLIEIVNTLVKQHNQDIELRLAGSGPLLKASKDLVDSLSLKNTVFFLGDLCNDSVLEEIAKANFYIQLSSDRKTKVPGGMYVHSEGMGRSILEAISLGTHVIVPNSGALKEIVTPQNGAIIDTNNKEEVFSIITKLLNNPPNKRSVTNKYSWTKLFEKYEKIFGG